MAVLTADVVGLSHQGNVTIIEFPADAADTYFIGSLVFTQAAGQVLITGVVDADTFVGISPKNQVITAAGQMVEVAIDGIWEFPNTNMAIAESGDLLYHDNSADSDNPADLDTYTGLTQESGVDEAVGLVLWTDGTTVKVNLAQRALAQRIPA